MDYKKPTPSIMPQWLWIEHRQRDIIEACIRHLESNANNEILIEYAKEFLDLCILKHRGRKENERNSWYTYLYRRKYEAGIKKIG